MTLALIGEEKSGREVVLDSATGEQARSVLSDLLRVCYESWTADGYKNFRISPQPSLVLTRSTPKAPAARVKLGVLGFGAPPIAAAPRITQAAQVSTQDFEIEETPAPGLRP